MTFEPATSPARPAIDDREAEGVDLARPQVPTAPTRQGERVLHDALRQWMIFTGVIGIGLVALVLTLTA